MADRTISTKQIVLNSTKFPISGLVRERIISPFPAKITTGDSDFSTEQFLSNWIISDQRGGILIENMDETVDYARSWYSTLWTRQNAAITLPPLASTVTTPTGLVTASIANRDFESGTTGWTATGSGTMTQSSTQAKFGTSSLKMNTGSTLTATYSVAWDASYQGEEFTATVWVYNEDTQANGSRIGIADGVGTTYSSYDTTGTTWTRITVTRTLDASATVLEVKLVKDSTSGSRIAYFDGVSLYATNGFTGYTKHFANFNSGLYSSQGTILSKLNSGGTAFTTVKANFPSEITALFEDGTSLYVLLGDTDFYWSMDVDEAFTESSTIGTFGLIWDAKVMVMDSAGTITEVGVGAKGKVPVSDNSVQNIIPYFDATGNDVIYAATNDGLYVHDYDNARWLGTALKTPNHTTSGEGLVVWNDALFMSAGQIIKKFTAGSTAVIQDVGFNNDDGLPMTRGGEIVKFVEGFEEYFILLDSTYEGTTSRSQVLGWDGTGYQVWWEATADNKNMYGGIVSSVVSHKVWFATTDGVYCIPVQSGTSNPKKVSGYTYAASGYHQTPWFDAGTKAFQKLAVRLNVFVSDMSATEKITIYYRINKADTSLDLDFTNWTKLTSTTYSNGITADGQTEFSFGTSGIGVLFYDIQFYLVFERGATTTASPVLNGMTLSYQKVPDVKKAFDVQINTAEAGIVASEPKKLYDLLIAAVESKNLIPFTYRNGAATTDTYYVKALPFTGATPASNDFRGIFNVTLVEL